MEDTGRGDVSEEVQIALCQLLITDPVLISLQENRVFDNVPQNTPYPYTKLGDDSWTDGGDKTDDGREGNLQIDVWADERNYVKLKKIMRRINAIVHDRDIPLVVEGAQVVTLRFNRSFNITEPDGCTRHGVLTYKIEINQPRS